MVKRKLSSKAKLAAVCDCGHSMLWHSRDVGVCGWPNCLCQAYFGKKLVKGGNNVTRRAIGVVTSGDGKVREEIL